MSDANASAVPDARIADTARWACAALVALAAHVGIAAWLLRERPIPADNTPPAAIMVELSTMPEAANTEMDEISPDQQTVDESTAAQQVQTPDETPPEEPVEAAELKPVESIEEPVEEEPVVEVEKPEVAIPVARAVFRETREITKKEAPKRPQKQRTSTSSKAKYQAKVQVERSNRTAANQMASGTAAVNPAGWQALLMAHLERRKRYPPAARLRGERGIAYVRFTIDGSGNVLSASLARSSGFAELDQEVLALVRRASPVPAPPPGVNRSITAPVRFSIN